MEIEIFKIDFYRFPTFNKQPNTHTHTQIVISFINKKINIKTLKRDTENGQKEESQKN